MRIVLLISFCFGLAATGCVEKQDAGEDAYTTSPGGHDGNAADEAREREIRADKTAACNSADTEAAVIAADESVHELITCGGMQVSLSRSFIALLLLSNDRMFDEATREDVEDQLGGFLPENDFEPVGNGRWRMTISPDSHFDLRFFGPRGGELITDDPFDMESYLVGLEATYLMTLDEMIAEPYVRNRWTFTWNSEGPLAHLLNGGEAVPDEFVVELSLAELAFLAFGNGIVDLEEEPELGVFASLLSIESDSKVFWRDRRQMLTGAALVDYHVVSPRRTVREIGTTGILPFDVVAFKSTVDDIEMVATDNTLEYADRKGLKGSLVLAGPRADATLDFGEGATYPERIYTCH